MFPRRERALPDGRRDASLRTGLLIADHDFDAARVLAEQHEIAPELLDSLAQQIARILALAPGPSSHAWVNQIRVQYGARRKLMSLLDAVAVHTESPSCTRSD